MALRGTCVPTTARSSSRGRSCAGSRSANIETALIDPGKPWQNGPNESFNGKFRDECLAMEWFKNRIDAKVVIETFRRGYNEVRPHSSLGQLTPVEFKQRVVNNQPGASHLLENPWSEESRQVTITL